MSAANVHLGVIQHDHLVCTGIGAVIDSLRQNPLTITDKPAEIRYGDTFYLSATGGSGSGAIHWSIKESNGVAAPGVCHSDGGSLFRAVVLNGGR